jgi:hypothetical protein
MTTSIRPILLAHLPVAMVLGGVLAGCAGTAADPEPVEQTQSPLYGNSDPNSHWPGGVVNVCFDPSTGNKPTLLATAQQLLKDSWGYVANVSFVGWSSCPSSPPIGSSWVSVHFVSGTNGSTTYPPGRHVGSTVEVDLISDGTWEHFQYEVIHEFGHALGFYHEQERPDNWPKGDSSPPEYCSQLDKGRQAVTGGIYYTACYDTASIMNYCAGQPLQLSGGDIDGVRAAYGFSPMCSLAAGCEPTDPDKGTVSVIDTASVWGRSIKLHTTSGGAAWASIENGQPGDEVWVDRSFDGGCAWDPKLGDTFTPQGWTLWRTLGYLQDYPALAMVRACGKAGDRVDIACTAWH